MAEEKKKYASFGEPVYWNKTELVTMANSDPQIVEMRRTRYPLDPNPALDMMTIAELQEPASIIQSIGRTNFTKRPVMILAEDGRVEAVILDYAMWRKSVERWDGTHFDFIAERLREVDPRDQVA